MKTMNEIIDNIYGICEAICSDVDDQLRNNQALGSEEMLYEDDDGNMRDYDNYFLCKDKYEAYKKVDDCSEIRWTEYTDMLIYEDGFTQKEIEMGCFYIDKKLYPEAQRVRTKHVRRGTI